MHLLFRREDAQRTTNAAMCQLPDDDERHSELRDWVVATRDFAVQILPLLCVGVLVARFLPGRPGHAALIPRHRVAGLALTRCR
jgi:hypothetical protein